MPDESGTPRHVVVAGASGLIGSALVDSLRADGVRVTTLVRRPPEAPDEVQWLTDGASLDPAVLEGAHAVVGMNGASIGRFPWTRSYKSTLLWSRITPTRTLATAIKALGADAPVFVSASAVGYYGSVPGRRLTESAPRGESFLADLCGEWESAALGAGPHARVVLTRTAPIVHPRGVLKPLAAADEARGRRADRTRHAGVAVDLAGRRGARHPARDGCRHRGSCEPHGTDTGDRQRPRLRARPGDEPPLPRARADLGRAARPRPGCDGCPARLGRGCRARRAAGLGFAFRAPDRGGCRRRGALRER